MTIRRIRVEAEKVISNFDKAARTIPATLVKGNAEFASQIRNLARRFAPHKTGRLKQGIVRLKIGDGSRYAIISKQPSGARVHTDGNAYNVFQEFGVSPIIGYSFVPGFGMVPTTRGFHPGIVPKKFMEKAFNWAERQYPENVRRTVSKALNKTFK